MSHLSSNRVIQVVQTRAFMHSTRVRKPTGSEELLLFRKLPSFLRALSGQKLALRDLLRHSTGEQMKLLRLEMPEEYPRIPRLTPHVSQKFGEHSMFATPVKIVICARWDTSRTNLKHRCVSPVIGCLHELVEYLVHDVFIIYFFQVHYSMVPSDNVR